MEPSDIEADSLAHSAHLAVASLMNRQFDEPLAALRLERARASRGTHDAGLELDAIAQPPQLLFGRRVIHPHLVDLLDAEARMHQVMRQVAVVGQHQQPAGIGIQAPDRKQPRAGRQELAHSTPALGITQRADYPDGLVEHVVAGLRFRGQRLARDLDAIAV